MITTTVKNLKGIRELSISLPRKPGLYAITGQNGCGKSTLMAALANLFHDNILSKYFHSPSARATISYSLEDKTEAHVFDKCWTEEKKNGGVFVNGLYEGSIIHGNRFRDNNYKSLFEADRVNRADLNQASSDIRTNFNFIIHGDKEHYPNMYYIDRKVAGQRYNFGGYPYFVETADKDLISQFNLSSGENLVISLLNSLELKLRKKRGNDYSMILIDEVELALHPSSTIRMLQVLKEYSQKYNLGIFFSTHSIELIRSISPDNIFYLKNYDGNIEVENPCYPAYATRSLFYHDGFDICILVEDVLAKYIVNRVIAEESLFYSKLIHVLPAGGWENVLTVQNDISKSNLLGFGKKVVSILDGDVKDVFKSRYTQKSVYTDLKVNFLPIPSLEKYLRAKLFETRDKTLIAEINDKYFRHRTIDDLVNEYKNSGKTDDDKSGKYLLQLLYKELETHLGSRMDFTNDIIQIIYKRENFDPLKNFLKTVI